MAHPLSEGGEDRTCGVCHEERRYLKMLPCRHTFCEYCLQNIIIAHHYHTFPCPMCRHDTPTPEGGASGFPIHTVGVADADVTLMARTTPSALLGPCSTCQVDADQMLFSCAQCRQVVCEWCQDGHTEQGHALVLLRAKREDHLQGEGPLNSSVCHQHGGHTLTHFCKSCKELLCEHCKQLQHRRHKLQELQEAAGRARQRLEEVGHQVAPLVDTLQWVHDDLNTCLTFLHHERDAIDQQIRDRATELRRRVDELEAAALTSLDNNASEIERHYRRDMRNVDTKLSGMKAKQRHIRSLLETGSDVSVVRMEPAAEHNVRRKKHLGQFTEQLPQDVYRLHYQGQGTLKTIEASLSKFVGSHCWEKSKRKKPKTD